MERREFLNLAGTGIIGGALSSGIAQGAESAGGIGGMKLPPLNLFSKHLQFLGYEEMATAAAKLGFDGIDLTVRKGGHVEPDHFERDLPAAIKVIREQGLKCDIMATDIVSTANPRDYDLLALARSLGVKAYRLGGLRYDKEADPMAGVQKYRDQLAALAGWNREIGINGLYQNHSGAGRFGAAVWDAYLVLQDLDPDFLGMQLDIRHAVVEGGLMWPTSFQLVQPCIRSLVFKDFKWATVDGQWKLVNTPMGQGMIDFKRYFRMLKDHGMDYPISLHCEYDLGGADKGKRELSIPATRVLDAIRQDVDTIRKRWQEA